MTARPPEALLLIAPGCPHCPGMLARLGERVKQGRLSRLEVVNVAAAPEQAAQLGVRSVPWTRIGPFELAGNLGEAEIDRWIDDAAHGQGMEDYLAHLLEQGALAQAEALMRARPDHLPLLLKILAAEASPLNVRVGVSALLEGLEGTPELRLLAGPLAELTRHPAPQVRGDACHLLGLAGDPEAIPALEACLKDPVDHVREIAADSLELLAPPGR